MLMENFQKKRFQSEDFHQRVQQFRQWSETFLHREVNQRLDGLTLATTLELLNNDIRTLVRDKQRLAADLLSQARLCTPPALELTRKIEQISTSLDEHLATKFVRSFLFLLCSMISTWLIRIQQVQRRVQMLDEYQQRLAQLRVWLNTVEVSLQPSIGTSRFQNNELAIHQGSIEVIEKEIDKHQPIVHSVLALGRTLCQENDLHSSDLEGLEEDLQGLEQRWIALQGLIQRRTNE